MIIFGGNNIERLASKGARIGVPKIIYKENCGEA